MPSLFSFFCGCLLAAAAWFLTWPKFTDEPSEIELREPSKNAPDKVNVSETLKLLTKDSMTSHPEALASISHMRVRDLEQVLDGRSSPTRDIDFAAKILLISWAQRDPEAALSWCWKKSLTHRNHDSFWNNSLAIICSEWAISNPSAAADWLIGHLGHDEDDGSSQSTSTIHLSLEQFDHAWFLRAPVTDYLKVCHALGGYDFYRTADYVANLTETGDLKLILSSWDQVPPQAVSSLDRKVAKQQAALEIITPDTPEYSQARQRLKWAQESRAKALGITKNLLIDEAIKRWKELDPQGWENSAFSDLKKWQ